MIAVGHIKLNMVIRNLTGFHPRGKTIPLKSERAEYINKETMNTNVLDEPKKLSMSNLGMK